MPSQNTSSGRDHHQGDQAKVNAHPDTSQGARLGIHGIMRQSRIEHETHSGSWLRPGLGPCAAELVCPNDRVWVDRVVRDVA
ncbi:MAG TPA: hypothetical protein PKE45_10425 [Caldilineaceae bacterium]|nr:hypothetical protein [Caldilineaceae bacterium]